MKKLAFTIVTASLALNGHTQVEKNQAMFDMMMSMAKANSQQDHSEAAKCLGVSESKMNAIFDKVMNACFERHKNETFTSFSENMPNCIEPMMEKETGFSRAQMEKCAEKSTGASGEDRRDRLEAELEGLYATIEGMGEDASGGTLDQAKLEQLQDKISQLEKELASAYEQDMGEAAMDMQAGMESLAENMAMISAASEKTLHLITLPIYKKSKVMAHMMDGVPMMGEAKSLPAATFASPDDVATIVAYYKKALPKFQYKALGNGEHIFMEKLPENFDILKHLKEYMSTPHVMIRPAANMPGTAAGTQAMIEIAYRE